MAGRWVLLLLVLLLNSVDSKKIHLDLKDIADLKIGDIMQMVLPAINSAKDKIKEGVSLDNIKAGVKTAGTLLGQGAQSAMKAYKDAGGVIGIAKSVAGKAVDAFEAAKDLMKQDSPLVTDPNFMAKKLGRPDVVPVNGTIGQIVGKPTNASMK